MHPLFPWLMILFLLLLLLPGCAGDMNKLKSTTTTPVCKALIGPLRYNTAKLNSKRHAGVDLAVDLKRRNQVGQQLRCPAYR